MSVIFSTPTSYLTAVDSFQNGTGAISVSTLSAPNILGDTRINGNVTINGRLTALSGSTLVNTTFITTSALSVSATLNIGPAFIVNANGTGDIASFYDSDQAVEMLHVGGANSTFPGVGIRVSAPNKTLTVSGEISATGDVWFSSIKGSGTTIQSYVSSAALSGTHYGDGSNLTGIVQDDVDATNLVKSNSANWNTAYNIITGGGTLSGTGLTVQASLSSPSLSGTHYGDGSNLTGIRPVMNVQTFSATGTWIKPAGARMVRVQLWSGGGGGGSGRKGAAGTVRCSGGGGGSGGYYDEIIDASAFGSSETITIGSGGTGGASISANSTDGNNGTVGGTTSFGTIISLPGGGAGSRGLSASGFGGGGSYGGNSGSSASTTGGAGTGGVPVSVNSAHTRASGSGASGGGISVGNVASTGNSGGRFVLLGLVGGTTGTIGSNGGNGPSASSIPTIAGLPLGASGGGGGGSSVTGNAGNGGSGGFPGGGGGGGGAAADGIGNSGAGGSGGSGAAIITTYF